MKNEESYFSHGLCSKEIRAVQDTLDKESGMI